MNDVLILLDEEVQERGGTGISAYGLDQPTIHERSNRILLRETSYLNQHEFFQENFHKLNDEQLHVYERVMTNVTNKQSGILFLDAPGGTGKTFLIRVILAAIRKENGIALACASSGIAATLLPGGRTAHATFKIPLNLEAGCTEICNLHKNTQISETLRQCRLIIWDECSMSNKKSFEAVDKSLRDITDTDLVFGGIPVLLCGDFRQILPVIPGGTISDEINASIKFSDLWNQVTVLNLSRNMRSLCPLFSQRVLSIGNGTGMTHLESNFQFTPEIATCMSSVEELERRIYSRYFDNEEATSEWLLERVILCPKNDDVNQTNDRILQHVPSVTQVYTSYDSVANPEDVLSYPVEFLNSLSPSGGSLHMLSLKVGVPVIVIRNLDPPKICNGSRGIVTQLGRRVIRIKLASTDEEVLIPKIPLVLEQIPIKFKRVQFPVRPCYAMTINKAQGQTLNIAGLNLTNPPFSHGQLYVAVSRTVSPSSLFVYAENNTTKNIVYHQILQDR